METIQKKTTTTSKANQKERKKLEGFRKEQLRKADDQSPIEEDAASGAPITEELPVVDLTVGSRRTSERTRYRSTHASNDAGGTLLEAMDTEPSEHSMD